MRTVEIILPKTSDLLKISIKKPDGTVITIDLPQEQVLSDILQVLISVLGGSSVNNTPLIKNDQASKILKSSDSSLVEGIDDLSVMEKIKILIKNTVSLLWFSSRDLQELYQHYFGKVPLSTVSTYLARLVENGILEKRGSRMKRKYKLIEDTLNTTPSIDLSKISVIPPTS